MVFLKVAYHQALHVNDKFVLYFEREGPPVRLRFREYGYTDSNHQIQEDKLGQEQVTQVRHGKGLLIGTKPAGDVHSHSHFE